MEGTQTISHFCPGQAQLAYNLPPTLPGLLPLLSKQWLMPPPTDTLKTIPPEQSLISPCLLFLLSHPPQLHPRLAIPYTLLPFLLTWFLLPGICVLVNLYSSYKSQIRCPLLQLPRKNESLPSWASTAPASLCLPYHSV